jgi:hypothetical protein
MFSKSDKSSQAGVAKSAGEKSASESGTTRSTAQSTARSQPAPSTPAAPQAQTATLRYVDRPEIAETFADCITGLFFDGQSLRIEFAVSRMDEVKPNTPITGRRYPACRLVLPPAAAVDLINRMQQIGAALAKAGVLKPADGARAQSS